MVAEQVPKPSVFQQDTFSPLAMAAMQMPMPGDPVTNERLETALFGIATQIVSGMPEVKSEMNALINEAELLRQANAQPELPFTPLHYATSSLKVRQPPSRHFVPKTLSCSSFSKGSPTWRRAHGAQKHRPGGSVNSDPRSC